jgi:lipopolysaccharide/colanic/teichoic acid biosynthesis glycosyltransferase
VAARNNPRESASFDPTNARAFPHPVSDGDALLTSYCRRRIQEEVAVSSIPAYLSRAFAKRSLDLIIGTVCGAACLPVLLFVSLWIKADSPGPVLFRQRRVGRNGKVFTILKFRTMVVDAERFTGPLWAVEDDPRCTRAGRILRRLKIDEIPQLLNVLRGEMSLVGPRPERPFFVNQLIEEFPEYTRRLLIKPGITGLAQIHQKADQKLEDVSRKQGLDFAYLERASLVLDLTVLWKTIGTALNGCDRPGPR